MPKQRSDLKILLLQIREDEPTMLEEFYEFVQFSGLQEDQFTTLNTYQTALFEPDVINGFDALFVGGSSDATVLDIEEYNFILSCKRLLRHCHQVNIPVLASCFGFQVAVEEFGGKVILDKENMELGQYQVYLNEAGRNDPLLFDLPNPFWTISGHKERASILPEKCEVLAYSPLCPYHVIKFTDKPFYGFQFHPEVDREDLIIRVTRYQDRYLESREELQQIIDDSVNETTHANALVSKFIDRIILQ